MSRPLMLPDGRRAFLATSDTVHSTDHSGGLTASRSSTAESEAAEIVCLVDGREHRVLLPPSWEAWASHELSPMVQRQIADCTSTERRSSSSRVGGPHSA